MATAPARGRPRSTSSSEPPRVTSSGRSRLSDEARARGGTVVRGGLPAGISEADVAAEAAHSERISTRRGRASYAAEQRAGKVGAAYGKAGKRGGGTSYRPRTFSAGPGGIRSTGGRVSTDAAGVLLAVFTWSWVILPAIRGGPAAVKDTLRAKFFNKDTDGGWLP